MILVHKECGSMCGGVLAGDIDLTKYIRKAIPIEDLAVFGGDYDE